MTPFKNPELNTFGLRVWSGHVNQSYPPHRHNEIELNAIEQGYFTYMLAGRETTVAEGQVALFWGAIPHQVIRFAPDTQVSWGTIPLDHLLRWDLPRSFVVSLLSGAFFCDPQPLYDLRFFHRWEEDMAAGRQSLALMELKALCFRFAALHPEAHIQALATGGTDSFNTRASRMALFMSRHFQDPLTVRDIAAVVNLHPNYAMSIFKEAFGVSLIEYLTQQRIAHAQQLLIMTDANISDVALDSGFQTLSHFYTAFQRLCRMPPGQYRASVLG